MKPWLGKVFWRQSWFYDIWDEEEYGGRVKSALNPSLNPSKSFVLLHICSIQSFICIFILPEAHMLRDEV